MKETFETKFKFALIPIVLILSVVLGIPAAAGISVLLDNIQENQP